MISLLAFGFLPRFSFYSLSPFSPSFLPPRLWVAYGSYPLRLLYMSVSLSLSLPHRLSFRKCPQRVGVAHWFKFFFFLLTHQTIKGTGPSLLTCTNFTGQRHRYIHGNGNGNGITRRNRAARALSLPCPVRLPFFRPLQVSPTVVFVARPHAIVLKEPSFSSPPLCNCT